MNERTVLIIGAGMAGVSAARHLHDAGFSVTVLEAQDRIGGRMWTDRSLGIPLDLGASWIHGVDGNPITALDEQYQARTIASIRQTIDFGATAPLFERLEAVVAGHRARTLSPPMLIFHDQEYTETPQDVEVVIPVTHAFTVRSLIFGETFARIDNHRDAVLGT